MFPWVLFGLVCRSSLRRPPTSTSCPRVTDWGRMCTESKRSQQRLVGRSDSSPKDWDINRIENRWSTDEEVQTWRSIETYRCWGLPRWRWSMDSVSDWFSDTVLSNKRVLLYRRTSQGSLSLELTGSSRKLRIHYGGVPSLRGCIRSINKDLHLLFLTSDTLYLDTVGDIIPSTLSVRELSPCLYLPKTVQV